MPEQQGDDRLRDYVMLGGATAFLSVLPFALMAAPVPLAALVYRRGLKAGISTALAAGVIASLLARNPLLLAQVLLALALGIALGEGLREGVGATQLVVLGTAVAMTTTLLLMYAVQRAFGVDVIEMLGLFWEEALGAGAGNSTGNPEAAEELRRTIELQMAQMRLALPAGLALGSLSLTVIVFALSRWLLAKLGESMESVPAMRPFHLWRFPAWVAFVYAGARLIELAAGGQGPALILWAVINAIVVAETLLLVQGVSVAWHFLPRVGAGVKVVALILALLFLQFVAAFALIALGFIDAIWDLRRWRTRKGEMSS